MSDARCDDCHEPTSRPICPRCADIRCTRPAPTEAEVLAAAKRAAAANSSMHEGYDLELFWRCLDERAQAHWLRVARAALGVSNG